MADRTHIFPGLVLYFWQNAGPIHGYAGPIYCNAGPVYGNAGSIHGHAGSIYDNAGPLYGNTGPIYVNAASIYVNAGPLYCNAGPIYSYVWGKHLAIYMTSIFANQDLLQVDMSTLCPITCLTVRKVVHLTFLQIWSNPSTF